MAKQQFGSMENDGKPMSAKPKKTSMLRKSVMAKRAVKKGAVNTLLKKAVAAGAKVPGMMGKKKY